MYIQLLQKLPGSCAVQLQFPHDSAIHFPKCHAVLDLLFGYSHTNTKCDFYLLGCDDKKQNRKRCQQRDTVQSIPKTVYIPRTTVIVDSLPSTDTIFVCFLVNIVSPSHISTPKARNTSTTSWTEHPLRAI
jgi:hypothetical protein